MPWDDTPRGDGLTILDLRLGQRTNGFPSPAADFAEARLDLSALLLRHPEATYFFRMESDALAASGLGPGDILVVDRALPPLTGGVVIAACDEGLLARRYTLLPQGGFALLADDPVYPPIRGGVDGAVSVWGVVTYCLRPLFPPLALHSQE